MSISTLLRMLAAGLLLAFGFHLNCHGQEITVRLIDFRSGIAMANRPLTMISFSGPNSGLVSVQLKTDSKGIAHVLA